jgi:hypothetical protein
LRLRARFGDGGGEAGEQGGTEVSRRESTDPVPQTPFDECLLPNPAAR